VEEGQETAVVDGEESDPFEDFNLAGSPPSLTASIDATDRPGG